MGTKERKTMRTLACHHGEGDKNIGVGFGCAGKQASKHLRLSVILVRMYPGTMALTLMRLRANSKERDVVKPVFVFVELGCQFICLFGEIEITHTHTHTLSFFTLHLIVFGINLPMTPALEAA